MNWLKDVIDFARRRKTIQQMVAEQMKRKIKARVKAHRISDYLAGEIIKEIDIATK